MYFLWLVGNTKNIPLLYLVPSSQNQEKCDISIQNWRWGEGGEADGEEKRELPGTISKPLDFKLIGALERRHNKTSAFNKDLCLS